MASAHYRPNPELAAPSRDPALRPPPAAGARHRRHAHARRARAARGDQRANVDLKIAAVALRGRPHAVEPRAVEARAEHAVAAGAERAERDRRLAGVWRLERGLVDEVPSAAEN